MGQTQPGEKPMMSKEVLAVVAAIILPTVHEELANDDVLESIDEAVAYAHDICQVVEDSLESDGKRDEKDEDAPQHRRKR
jgi:hypothetical protein